MRLLTDAQAQLLRDVKKDLADTRLALAELDAPREALTTLQQAIQQLDELFLMVVVGEFNAGKSALLNALLGERVMAEGVTPTTARVTLVKWGEQITETITDETFATYTHPLALLRELNIVDTPGTNAVIRQHERLTNEFVPRSDLVLFVTSADRPMTESERQFLERIREWGKKVVLILNKADLFEQPSQLAEVRAFVLPHATQVLGAPPEFFPVSAKLAQKARETADLAEKRRLREASGLDALERYIVEVLDDAARLALKFQNPLGVAGRLVDAAWTTAAAEAADLTEDKETVQALDATVSAYTRELQAELTPRLAEIEAILLRLEARGNDFFDRTLRLTNIVELTRGDQVRLKFEKEVLGDVPAQIEQHVRRLIDWLVDKDLRQWQTVMSYLQKRQARYNEQLVGEGAAPLEARRRSLVDTVGKTAQTIVDTYDREQEARAVASSVETAVAQTALLEAGAVGLGALIVSLFASSTIDVTGVLAAGLIAIVGLFVIPYKRRQAKEQFSAKMEELRGKLQSALTNQFRNESENAIDRLREGVGPYTRFVRAERERVEKTQTALEGLRQKVSALRARTAALFQESDGHPTGLMPRN
ncbi:MAG: dynamin family protein [Anaerolineales bacterium]|nr:dynamin family protein [Anaerolineales bacterium]